MRKSLVAAVVGTTLGLMPVLALAGSAPTTNTPANDPNRVVCKQGEAPVGTLIPASRVCHTQREWDEMTQQAHHTIDTIEMHNSSMNMPGGG